MRGLLSCILRGLSPNENTCCSRFTRHLVYVGGAGVPGAGGRRGGVVERWLRGKHGGSAGPEGDGGPGVGIPVSSLRQRVRQSRGTSGAGARQEVRTPHTLRKPAENFDPPAESPVI